MPSPPAVNSRSRTIRICCRCGGAGWLSKRGTRHVELSSRSERFEGLRVNHLHSNPGVSNRGAKVSKGRRSQLLPETIDRKTSGFQLQNRRDAIEQLETVSELRHTMRMQVNKAGANHEATRVDGCFSHQRVLTD